MKNGETMKQWEKRVKTESKNKLKQEKGNKDMKTTAKTVAKYTATVIVTLAVVYAGYWLYGQGYNQGKADQRSVAAEVSHMVSQSLTNQK